MPTRSWLAALLLLLASCALNPSVRPPVLPTVSPAIALITLHIYGLNHCPLSATVQAGEEWAAADEMGEVSFALPTQTVQDFYITIAGYEPWRGTLLVPPVVAMVYPVELTPRNWRAIPFLSDRQAQ